MAQYDVFDPPSFENFFMELKRNLSRATKHGSSLMCKVR